MRDAPLERVVLNVCQPRSDKVGKLYAHCNWGWGGLDDGYYYLPSGIEYNDNIRAIYGIAPIH